MFYTILNPNGTVYATDYDMDDVLDFVTQCDGDEALAKCELEHSGKYEFEDDVGNKFTVTVQA